MVKEKLSDFNPIRIETSTINGFPDLILFNKYGRSLFVECKACERSRLLQSLRPHQKAFHHKYKQIMNGLFILQRSVKERAFFLYRSKDIDFLADLRYLDRTVREPRKSLTDPQKSPPGSHGAGLVLATYTHYRSKICV